MIKESITQKDIMDILIYDPATGIFTWKHHRGRVAKGAVAGWPDKYGYVNIGLFHLNYAAHRLAWLYVYGEWPEGQVDHKNMNITDNRIDNLRVAQMADQRANQHVRKDSTVGLKGVKQPTKYGRYAARIGRNGVSYHLGFFGTPEEAHAAYLAKATELFGEFARST